MKKIASEKFGFVLIIAALVVISLISTQILMQSHSSRIKALNIEGRNLVYLLSSLPFEQLVPTQGRNRILELLNNPLVSPDFAYVAIVNPNSQPIAIATSSKITIPQVSMGNEKTLWASEQVLTTEMGKLTEFRAPLLSKGELAGYIRAGYFHPGYEFDLQKLPFFGQIALPIFLLVPFNYWLIRRELSPLHQASDKLHEALRKHQFNAVDMADDSHDFMKKLKIFIGMIDQRIEDLSNQNIKSQSATLALSYQRRRVESALQTLPDAILVMDETGIATFANSRLMSLFSGSLDSVLGSKPHDWCDNDNIIELLAKYYSSNRPLQRPESIEYIPKNHPAKTIEVSAYPLFSPKESETFCGALVVFHDKTQEVMASQARDEFISHVAHELKSPLNIIHLYAESLLNQQGIPDDHRINAANTINDEVERLASLISHLLNITKIEAGNLTLNLQRVKFIEFLEDTFNSVARSGSENNIRFDLQLPRTLPNIHVDKDLLRIAFNNLLTNAVKYNKPGGSVCLSAEDVGDNIVIRVSDTGIGIAEKDAAHIFDKFYRSPDSNVRERSGHGLGLSLAKEIVELHQGKIQLESRPGSGSIFIVELKKVENLL